MCLSLNVYSKSKSAHYHHITTPNCFLFGIFVSSVARAPITESSAGIHTFTPLDIIVTNRSVPLTRADQDLLTPYQWHDQL